MFITKWLAAFGRYLQLMGRVLSIPERWRMFFRQYVREMHTDKAQHSKSLDADIHNWIHD